MRLLLFVCLLACVYGNERAERSVDMEGSQVLGEESGTNAESGTSEKPEGGEESASPSGEESGTNAEGGTSEKPEGSESSTLSDESAWETRYMREMTELMRSAHQSNEAARRDLRKMQQSSEHRQRLLDELIASMRQMKGHVAAPLREWNEAMGLTVHALREKWDAMQSGVGELQKRLEALELFVHNRCVCPSATALKWVEDSRAGQHVQEESKYDIPRELMEEYSKRAM